SLDWLDASSVPEGAIPLLLQARAELSQCDLGYYTWRTSWRIGQVYLRKLRLKEAKEFLFQARSELMELLRSVESPRLSDSFLSLPAACEMLDALERAH